MAADNNLHGDQFVRHMPGQGQLFDRSTTRKQTPGEMPMDKWLQQPGVAYHGTFRHDWDQAPYAHFGTEDTAVDRLKTAKSMLKSSPTHRASYYSGEDVGEDYEPPEKGMFGSEPEEHTGRLYAHKLDVAKDVGGERYVSDMQANSAQYHSLRKEGYEHWEIPPSITESSSSDVKERWHTASSYGEEPELKGQAGRAAHVLEQGKAVPYHNPYEGQQAGKSANISYVAPRGSSHTWEEDVTQSPHASVFAQQFARQRQEQGLAGTVPHENTDRRSPGSQTYLSVNQPYHPNQRQKGPWLEPGRDTGKPLPAPKAKVSKTQFYTDD